MRFNDPRRFGLIDYVRRGEAAGIRCSAGLGPEPLEPGFDGAYLDRQARRQADARSSRRCSISGSSPGSATSMSARRSTAPGCRRDASPRRSAGDAPTRLAAAIRDRFSTEAIAAGGSSLRDYVQANGELGYFQHRWAVYGREGEPCPGCNCAEGVRRIVQSGRSTFYCANRQR